MAWVPRAGLLLVACVAAGCPGDVALDSETPMRFTVQSPPLFDDAYLRFGDQDVAALGLERSEWPVGAGPGWDSTSVSTDLTQTADDRPVHCFEEPVHLVGPAVELMLIEPGECFGDTYGTTMDRVSVELLEPGTRELVSGEVLVRFRQEAQVAEGSSVQVLVKGEPVAEVPLETDNVMVDLSEVEPGATTIRVEVLSPGGTRIAATLVEVIVEP